MPRTPPITVGSSDSSSIGGSSSSNSKFRFLDTDEHGQTRTDLEIARHIALNPCSSVSVRVQKESDLMLQVRIWNYCGSSSAMAGRVFNAIAQHKTTPNTIYKVIFVLMLPPSPEHLRSLKRSVPQSLPRCHPVLSTRLLARPDSSQTARQPLRHYEPT